MKGEEERRCVVALGVGWDGRHRVLGVELADRESGSSWKAFLTGLKERGFASVRLAVSDG